MIASFCSLFGRLIATLHDGEFCQEDILPGATSKIMPFQLNEIILLSSFLKDLSLGLVELAYPETRTNVNEHYRFALQPDQLHSAAVSNPAENLVANSMMWPHLLRVCVSLLRQLHTRDLRRTFCPANHWTVQNLNLPLDKTTNLEMPRGGRGPRPFQPIRDFTREDFGKRFLLRSTTRLGHARNALNWFVVLFCRNQRSAIINQTNSIDYHSTRDSFCCTIQFTRRHIPRPSGCRSSEVGTQFIKSKLSQLLKIYPFLFY